MFKTYIVVTDDDAASVLGIIVLLNFVLSEQNV